MHDGMVMANKGFQDKLFKMYTGQSLKGVRSLPHVYLLATFLTRDMIFHLSIHSHQACTSPMCFPLGYLDSCATALPITPSAPRAPTTPAANGE